MTVNIAILNQATCITCIFVIQGRIQGGAHPVHAPPPLKMEKNMIFWRKIEIFHMKYPKNVRASLRWAQFF
jgi:hypothetical protein